MSKDIVLTQSGQPRPYADNEYAGTVVADTEEDAREKLRLMRSSTVPILDRQAKGGDWSLPYFKMFKQVEPTKWQFRIIEEFTG